MLHKSPECILKPEVAYEHLRYLKESRRFHRHRIACHERKCPRQRKNETKILAIMAENDYTPNAFARGLGLNTMKTIGLLCADSSDQFFSRAVYYLERALRSNHYDAILSCTGADYDTRTEYLKRLLAKKVDAVILVGSSFIEAVPERNRYIIDAAEEVPVIILNGYLRAPNVYCSLCDDQEIVQQAASVCLEHGRRDLLFLYRADSYSGRRKLKGFKEAFAAAELTLDPKRIVLFLTAASGDKGKASLPCFRGAHVRHGHRRG